MYFNFTGIPNWKFGNVSIKAISISHSKGCSRNILKCAFLMLSDFIIHAYTCLLFIRHERTLSTHDYLIQSIWCILTHVPESVNTKYIHGPCMCMALKKLCRHCCHKLCFSSRGTNNPYEEWDKRWIRRTRHCVSTYVHLYVLHLTSSLTKWETDP